MGFGFAINRTPPEKPRLQVIAAASSENLERFASFLAGVDSLLLETDASGDLQSGKFCREGNEIPAGIWLRNKEALSLNLMMAPECDFVVFPAEIPLSAVPEERIGRILHLDLSLGEMLLRAVNELPVDAVLVAWNGGGEPVTLNYLLCVQRVAYLVNKPILVQVPLNAGPRELQALWDTGVVGAIVEFSDSESAGKIPGLVEQAAKLSPPNLHKKVKLSPVIPRLQPQKTQPEEEEEDE
jgi:hypothetical protein